MIHSAVTVGTAATVLFTAPTGRGRMKVYINNADSASIFVGDATVATSGANKGLEIPKSTIALELELFSGDVLYGISSLGTTANAVTVFCGG